MELKIDNTVIEIGIESIQKSLEKKSSKENRSYQGQLLSVEFLQLLAQQILIPILISLSSSALYDVLKGKVLSRMNRKETKRIISGFQKHKINTSVPLSEECMKVIFDELSPLGLKEGDISILYEQIKINVEKHVKQTVQEEND